MSGVPRIPGTCPPPVTPATRPLCESGQSSHPPRANSLVPAGTVLGPSGSSNDSKLLGDTNNNGVINDGEGLCFDAVAPDNNVSDPELAEFSNRVDVSAVPPLGSATPQTRFSTDSCPLCVANTE